LKVTIAVGTTVDRRLKDKFVAGIRQLRAPLIMHLDRFDNLEYCIDHV
jgi:hypothetical protein